MLLGWLASAVGSEFKVVGVGVEMGLRWLRSLNCDVRIHRGCGLLQCVHAFICSNEIQMISKRSKWPVEKWKQ